MSITITYQIREAFLKEFSISFLSIFHEKTEDWLIKLGKKCSFKKSKFIALAVSFQAPECYPPRLPYNLESAPLASVHLTISLADGHNISICQRTAYESGAGNEVYLLAEQIELAISNPKLYQWPSQFSISDTYY